MQKKLLILVVAILVLVGGVVLVWEKKNSQIVNQNPEPVQGNTQNSDKNDVFITDVDPDVNHWQTKETEFFTIKFPKEWYWMESKHEVSEGYSKVITNNPDFDMVKNAEIGLHAGLTYPLILSNNTEVVIAFSGVAVTRESGTPIESIDWQLKRVKAYVNHNATCSRNDADKPYPTALCTFVNDESQNIQVYFVAEKSVTYAFTARTTKENTIDMKPILERIAKSYMPNYSSREE